MITNERQYAITKAELRRFEEAVGKYTPSPGVDPRMKGVMDAALEGQADTLRDEIKRYEDLRAGRIGQGVGVERLQEVADALGMGVTETVSYTVPAMT